MINIDTFVLGPVSTNAYLLSDPETKKGIIIDPGMNPKSLIKKIADLDIEAILLTHAHFDHIGGVDEIRKLKNCPVYVHDLEADWLTNPKKNGSARWPELGVLIETEPAEYALDEGQILEFLGIKLKVFHTPGHSPGSVSFLYDKHLFSGDVLFKLSVGRTDLPGGNNNELLDSIQDKLFILEDDVVVYSGHGAKTTIGFERDNNPYV
ncbi:MBL fold metallo-hydrolase [Paenibacillus aceris]|uniref:Glyoxylase-like metal-dependent hydrolase (Beta-lactamase superfamily II) n=1 Tax=Paenibacillus aceris TaxID=869555 RepID=A0ABS4I8T9_9BACL|nr:MBL fold metallo-hydrolase [Paenibacillus aceris]MBP1966881.1 glyoxylase-like metal-dependent hydrolase (beta-lactamase superfamily II) [Paenibacillus aceris]NHW38953.1 MBL fold metallo-hydrolase [Paenibacillus aceris]